MRKTRKEKASYNTFKKKGKGINELWHKCVNNKMPICCAENQVLSKIKKMKTERQSAGDFLILSLFFHSSIYGMNDK